MANMITIGFSSNPELASALAQVPIGSTGKADVEFRVIAKDEVGMQAEVVSFIPDGYAPDDEQQVNQAPDTAGPSPATMLP